MKKKILLAALAITVAVLTVSGQVFNAAYWVQQEFNIAAYSPFSVWIWMLGSVLWLLYVWYSKAHWGFYIIGIIGIVYAMVRLMMTMNWI